jgi:subtilisin family serine protease
MAGLEWVVEHVKETERPSVGSMSLGGTANPALDQAVSNTIEAGIQIAVAAGNSNQPAILYSPARVIEAITVAASNIQNEQAFFSNWGLPVDIFAPGVNITSTWIGDNNAVKTISGTSMATPHVAGLCAYILSKEPSLDPTALAKKVRALGTPDKLSKVTATTPNLLAYNGGENGIESTGASGPGAATDASAASASAAGANVLSTASNSATGALSTANAANFEALSNSVPSNVPAGGAQTQ